MTGFNNQKDQRKGLTGPKIRHPSGITYPTIIFMKEKQDLDQLSNAAKLYQNILEYPLSKRNPEPTFKITDMGYWVLEQNDDYRNYYLGSHIRMSIRLENVLKRIKRYLDSMIRWGLVELVGEVDSNTKNGQKTSLYRFTDVGYIIAYAVEYHNFYNGYDKLGKIENLDTMKKIKWTIFELIKSFLSKIHSYMTDFLAKFYTKCMEYDMSNNCPFEAVDGDERKLRIGIFDRIIFTLVNILIADEFHFPNGIEYLSAAHTNILTNEQTANAALRLYLMSLEEFPDRIRNLIIAHEKAEIESRFLVSQPPKNWEEAWLKNRANYDNIVLYAVCQNKECKERYLPVMIPYRLYRQKLVTASKTVNYDDGFPPMYYIFHDCPICKTKDSMLIFDSYENVVRYGNQSKKLQNDTETTL
jgi:hypothetical protein